MTRIAPSRDTKLTGATVTFTVTTGEGTLSVTTATTDENGRTATTLTSGSQPGTNTVVASADDLEPVTFAAIGLGVPRNLTEVSGLEQQGPAGATLTNPFVVLVLDQNGDPVVGATVTFTVTTGEGTLSVTTATTDENGRAATTLTLGSQLGTNTVVATVEDLEPVTFTATGKASPDFDGDGTVGFADFVQFAAQFGLSHDDERYVARYDLDGDGAIGFGDFLIFAGSFGKDIPSSGSGGGEGGGGSSQTCAVGLALNPGDGCSGSGYSLRNDAGVLVADGNIGGIAMDNSASAAAVCNGTDCT